MKSILLVLALLCAPAFAHDKPKPVNPPTPPAYQDSFDGWQRHIAFHTVTGFAARQQWPDEPVKAWAVAMIPGLIGELLAEMDRPRNKFSPRDMLSNAVGAAIGVGVGGFVVHMTADAVRITYQTRF